MVEMLAEKLSIYHMSVVFVMQSNSFQGTLCETVGSASVTDGTATEMPAVRMSYSLRTLQRYLYQTCFCICFCLSLRHATRGLSFP